MADEDVMASIAKNPELDPAKVIKHAVEDSGNDEAAARAKVEELVANPHDCCLKSTA